MVNTKNPQQDSFTFLAQQDLEERKEREQCINEHQRLMAALDTVIQNIDYYDTDSRIDLSFTAIPSKLNK